MIRDMAIDFRLWRQPVLAAGIGIAALMTTGCGSDSTPSLPGTLNTIQVLGEPGTQRGQFVYPRAMDVYQVDGHPRAAIIDKTARIQIMDLVSGKVLGSIHTPKWDRGKPTGVTVAVSPIDPTKLAVYVADTHEHRVLVYQLPLPDVEVPVPTEPDLKFGSFGEEPGQFIYPTDVAVDLDDSGTVTDLYVSEYGGNDRISRFKLNRSNDTISFDFVNQIGIKGEEVDASDGPTALSRPQSIALWTDPDGRKELIVTDASHHRVGRLTLDDQLIKWFGDPLDTSDNAFRFPYGLTILDNATALIAEFGSNRVRCIDLETGETLWRYGVAGRSVGQLAQPWASGVIGDKLVILDSGNSRLQICALPKGVSSIGHEIAQGPQAMGTIGGIAP
jgi:PQQ enzyme repeat